MPINIPKTQKTSGSLSNFYLDNWEKGGIEINILYLIPYNLQRLTQGPIGFRKQRYYNKLSFCFSVRSQNIKD